MKKARTKASVGGDAVATGLAKIGLVLRHQAWQAGETSGLTPTQSQVLAVVLASPEGWLGVSEVARQLAVTQPTASDAITALERKKLVVRDRAGHDARVVRVRVTTEGRRRSRESAQWPDALLKAIDELDPVERGVFVKGLTKMIRSLQESGRISTVRMCATCTYFRPHQHPGAQAPHHCAYVDAPLRDADLRLDCQEHELAGEDVRPKLWQVFIKGGPSGEAVSPGAWPAMPTKSRGIRS
ncbi:MAG: winged helix-turn-helix transcriptional regulator [Phycisphaeraceae bacterium]|nr:winged helix-turn-helix transcriptional regulator [Phycisphaerae bacterium]MBX3391356.1 winged helix-turn-helix transcriptional regulator [Phycisphaeraceae bacterium]HRJ50947.1 MarR family winged helix-turn-helix transcriptional regulator [Phycisphaerales bacterium]